MNPRLAPAPRSFTALKMLYRDKEYADFTIKCGNDCHKVHKAAVCPRSPFFRAALDESNNTEESRTSVVDLSEHDPMAVRVMVYFVYHNEYPYLAADGSISTFQPEEPNLIAHLRVLELADFCQMDTLKECAIHDFEQGAELFCRDDEFLHVARLIYTSVTPENDKLRLIIVGVLMEHRHLMIDPDYQELSKSSDLAHELLIKIQEDGKWDI